MATTKLTFTSEQIIALSTAMKDAVNVIMKHGTEEQKANVLHAAFAWGRAQPDYDGMSSFRRECEEHGCD